MKTMEMLAFCDILSNYIGICQACVWRGGEGRGGGWKMEGG